MAEWGVRHSGPQGQVRPVADLGHAQAVLRGLPDHYLPAEVVLLSAGRVQVIERREAPEGAR